MSQAAFEHGQTNATMSTPQNLTDFYRKHRGPRQYAQTIYDTDLEIRAYTAGFWESFRVFFSLWIVDGTYVVTSNKARSPHIAVTPVSSRRVARVP